KSAGRAPHDSLDKLRDQLDDLSKAAAEISHDLYPVNLEFLGLERALERLCADVGQRSALAVGYTTRDLPPQLPTDVALCLYRVAQEALQNIVRHSRACHVSVHVDGVERQL